MRFRVAFGSLLIPLTITFAQKTDSVGTLMNPTTDAIKAEVSVDRKNVPQNRTVTFTLRISWSGDLDRYEIVDVENPVLNNLEIEKSATSNWVGEIDGTRHAAKIYDFTLMPQGLGMAYIDGMIIDYLDRNYDEQHSLVTNRLEIKIIDPVIEADYSIWYLTGGIVLVLAVAFFAGQNILQRKKAREAERLAQELADRPLEENYLPELKSSVDLQSASPVDSFSVLSKLFRRYLSEKYAVTALEGTTAEICEQLTRQGIDSQIVEHTKEVLDSCDVAKFSGGNVQQDVLERSYTLVEDILTKNKVFSLNRTNEEKTNET